MAKFVESEDRDGVGLLSAYQLLTLYFPAFVFALGYSIATPAIPVLAKSFDTGFGVASLVGLFYYGYAPFSLVAGVALDQLGPPAAAGISDE